MYVDRPHFRRAANRLRGVSDAAAVFGRDAEGVRPLRYWGPAADVGTAEHAGAFRTPRLRHSGSSAASAFANSPCTEPMGIRGTCGSAQSSQRRQCTCSQPRASLNASPVLLPVLPPVLPPLATGRTQGRARTIRDTIHRLSRANATRQDDAVGFRTRSKALSRRRSRDRSPSGARAAGGGQSSPPEVGLTWAR